MMGVSAQPARMLQPIPMFSLSGAEEALVRAYVNGTPACLDAKSDHRLTARCSKCRVFLGDKARLCATELRTAGSAVRTGTPGSGFNVFFFFLYLSPNWVTDLDGWYYSSCSDATHTPMRRCEWMLLPSVSRLGYSRR